MEKFDFRGYIEYKIEKVAFVENMRDSGHDIVFKNGKTLNTYAYVKSGEIKIDFFGAAPAINIKAGEVIYIPKGMPYISEYARNNTRVKVLMFEFEDGVLPECLKKINHIKNMDASSVFDSIPVREPINTLLLASKLYEMIYITEENNNYIPGKYKDVIPVVEEIKRNYFENKKISFYADKCYMSESRFRRLFVELTGETPIRYRNQIRIIEADKMIRSGEYTVQEAAYLTGFNNMAFFYTVYNEYKKGHIRNMR